MSGMLMIKLVLIGVIVCGVLLTFLAIRVVGRGTTSSGYDASLAATLKGEIIDSILRMERESQAALRAELQNEQRQTRADLLAMNQQHMLQLQQTLVERLTALQTQNEAQLEKIRLSMDESIKKTLAEHRQARIEMQTTNQQQVSRLQQTLDERLKTLQTQNATQLEQVRSTVDENLKKTLSEQRQTRTELLTMVQQQMAQLHRILEDRLTAIQTRNSEQLEKMRVIVDEKLQKTLDERISQSFKLVNERLSEVYKGLGEMQALAVGVGDLKKVMSGIKTRGIFGEIRLGSIMSEILLPEQYLENAVTRPNTANRVEFAVKLPGEGEAPVLLPIDAKFPADAYHHLVDAQEAGDPVRIKEAKAALEARVKGCAKDIHDKYLEPPYTTTFAILFLPFESLYAEVASMGLIDVLRQQYQVTLAGPTTLAALLNSLQMGFRTLAIQKRSNEVWEVLGAVKTEFGNFEKVLAKAKERIDQTGDELEKLIGTRTRQINRKLRAVAELPAEDAVQLLADR